MTRRILFVDDDEKNRTSYSRYLRALGYEVETCATFKHAQQHVSEHNPDAVITDTQLNDPEFNEPFWGFDLARSLRLNNYQGPIIGISGNYPNHRPKGYRETIEDLYHHAQADGFVQKIRFSERIEDLLTKAFAERTRNT